VIWNGNNILIKQKSKDVDDHFIQRVNAARMLLKKFNPQIKVKGIKINKLEPKE